MNPMIWSNPGRQGPVTTMTRKTLHSILILLLTCFSVQAAEIPRLSYSHGGIVRGDTTRQIIHLVFTGHEFSDGGSHIQTTLRKHHVPAHFFFTGDFYREKDNYRLIKRLLRDGHYLGAHSDRHLLYATWEDRDSLLVDKYTFASDLKANYAEMKRFGIEYQDADLFMPPYEWYNQRITEWTEELGLTLINFSPGTRSNADYTWPSMNERYIDSQQIYQSILEYEAKSDHGLNGFFLLIHIGTDPRRTDKFYLYLDELILELQSRGYSFTLFQP